MSKETGKGSHSEAPIFCYGVKILPQKHIHEMNDKIMLVFKKRCVLSGYGTKMFIDDISSEKQERTFMIIYVN